MDDYVKFIRFAQWKIAEQNHPGIIAFITNNYYLDGLTFRGMRYSLKTDFDEIWVINLHGDMRKGIPEHIRNNGILIDENVFGNKTSVGVAIVFLIKTSKESRIECDIQYTEKWGKKAEKYEYLSLPIENLDFQNIEEGIDYEFIPDLFVNRKKYQSFHYIVDIFKENIQGIITGHDHDIIDYSKGETIRKIENLFLKYSDPPNLPKKFWNPYKVLDTNVNQAKNDIKEWYWRGFDRRYISYNDKLIARPSFKLLQFLLPPNNENVVLIINRRSRGCKGDSSVFISNIIFDNACIEGATGLKCYAFPLKMNDTRRKYDFRQPLEASHSNINPDFTSNLNYKEKISDKQIFYYIYGILFTPTYRSRYQFGLKEEFPRIPFPKTEAFLISISEIGKKLANLHLFRSPDLNTSHFEMSKSEDYIVFYVRKSDKDEFGNQIPDTYDPNTKRIYFKKRNSTQIKKEAEGDRLDGITWIGGITQEMWDFEIGGRQQLKEWLYARRYSEEIKKKTIQRPLNNVELDYFLKMCDAIKKTIDLLPELDEIYKKIDP